MLSMERVRRATGLPAHQRRAPRKTGKVSALRKSQPISQMRPLEGPGFRSEVFASALYPAPQAISRAEEGAVNPAAPRTAAEWCPHPRFVIPRPTAPLPLLTASSPSQWKKHWFVLTDSSLKYYRDSTAEEVRPSGGVLCPYQVLGGPWKGIGAGGPGQGSGRRGPSWASLRQADELDGEIDLRSCTDVTEYAVQRNYGFQIHVSLVQLGWHGGAGGGLRDRLLSPAVPEAVLRAGQKFCCQCLACLGRPQRSQVAGEGGTLGRSWSFDTHTPPLLLPGRRTSGSVLQGKGHPPWGVQWRGNRGGGAGLAMWQTCLRGGLADQGCRLHLVGHDLGYPAKLD